VKAILGQLVAHEIGHLFGLPHAQEGFMRAAVTLAER
jgi:predicted Zn-dependent protease